MNEKELKKKINGLRNEIDHKNKKLKDIYHELGFHRRDADTLRTKRDQFNEKAKKLRQEAKSFVAKRDKVNEDIGKLKNKRASLIEKIKTLTRDIKETKGYRDELNRIARAPDTLLTEIYLRDIEKLVEKDMPIEDEVRLFDKIFEVKDRLLAAKKADTVHGKVSSTYEEVKKLNLNIDKINESVQSLAEESQENHQRAMNIYKEIDVISEESTQSHKKLVEKYELMNPLRDQIGSIKEEIKVVQEKLAPFVEEWEKIRHEREERKKSQDALKAKERLQSKKRISIDDFRVLLEKNELELPVAK